MDKRIIMSLAMFLGAPRASAAEMPTWLAGTWCLESGETLTIERWMNPSSNLMLGLSETTSGGRTSAFEFLRIENGEDGVRYLAQPGGRTPVAFAMGEHSQGHVRFENRAHDFPQVIAYRRDADRLVAEISGPDGKGGETSIPFAFVACPDR